MRMSWYVILNKATRKVISSIGTSSYSACRSIGVPFKDAAIVRCKKGITISRVVSKLHKLARSL